MSETFRTICARCRRPEVVCYCASIPQLPTRTHVMLLQHPREQHTPIGSARMAHLGLPNSSLHIGLDFSHDARVAPQLADTRSTFVVFPHPDAIALADLPRDRPITLVVLDGTWWQAQKLRKLNPLLQALPHVAFLPTQPSQYRIRRQPQEHCVSTIEALAEVLNVLEPEHGPFTPLLAPFEAMVNRQVEFASDVSASRHRKPDAANRPPAPTLGARLQQQGIDWSRIVCVQGEANAWPFDHPDRAAPEIVHWTAVRPSTGQTYAAIIAPSRPLAPSTPHHLRVPASAIHGGISRAAWRASWEVFVRPDDVVVQWGSFGGKLAFGGEPAALPMPTRVLDVRSIALHELRRPVGAIEDCLAMIDDTNSSSLVGPRAETRLASLLAVLRALWQRPRQNRPTLVPSPPMEIR